MASLEIIDITDDLDNGRWYIEIFSDLSIAFDAISWYFTKQSWVTMDMETHNRSGLKANLQKKIINFDVTYLILTIYL